MLSREFYRNKKVFVTGHTGFKGAWMCKVLLMLGANVTGYALKAENESLYNLLSLDEQMSSIIGDISDFDLLKKSIEAFQPEIVIHMAAQPLVRESYNNPVYTFETNVMGTVNILEAIRLVNSVKSVVNVTTDKVYLNKEWEWGYRENDELNGFDPYSNSKSCSELVTSAYINSYFMNRDCAISTCRAGNVIGGGDFAIDRIIPDCVRAMEKKESISVRNQYSTRPYQHVLEPVFCYLYLAQKQCDESSIASSYNIGPNETDCLRTGELVNIFCDKWGENADWIDMTEKNAPHEANFLKLDCSKIKSRLDWSPIWSAETAVEKTVEWSKVYLDGENVIEQTEIQIKEYMK